MTWHILVVCTYNRTRSVMMQLLLQRALSEAGARASVVGGGFQEDGVPPLDDTVRALRRAGLDASTLASHRVTAGDVAQADLILTAEKLHVVRLAEDRLDVFARAFTLPEFAGLASTTGARAGRPLGAWLAAVGGERTHATFLGAATPEVADPTGQPPAAFDATVAQIDRWSRTVASLL